MHTKSKNTKIITINLLKFEKKALKLNILIFILIIVIIKLIIIIIIKTMDTFTAPVSAALGAHGSPLAAPDKDVHTNKIGSLPTLELSVGETPTR